MPLVLLFPGAPAGEYVALPYSGTRWDLMPNLYVTTDARYDHDASVAAFNDDWDPLLVRVKESGGIVILFGTTVIANPDGLLSRVAAKQAQHGFAFAIQTAGARGYAPALNVPATTKDGSNGAASAALDLSTSFAAADAAGLVTTWVWMDTGLGRVILNGRNYTPHAAFRSSIFPAQANASIALTARTAGAAGNNISITFVAGGSLAIGVVGTAITVTFVSGVTTAAQVRTAIADDAAANALVSTALPSGHDGTGLVTTLATLALVFGDDGYNYTSAEMAVEVGSYMATLRASRGQALNVACHEPTILYPLQGVPGYDAREFPAGQRPDFARSVWPALMARLTAIGSPLTAFNDDNAYEWTEGLVTSNNSAADDWYMKIFRTQDLVITSGVEYANLVTSYFGGDSAAVGAPAGFASDAATQDAMIAYIEKLKERHDALRPDLPPFDRLAFGSYYEFPEKLAPYHTPDSLADTALRVFARYPDLRGSATAMETLMGVAA